MIRLIIVLGACLIGLISFFYSESHPNGEPDSPAGFDLKLTGKEYLLLTLSSELERINAELPVNVDQNTILRSVAITNETIINSYTLMNVPNSNLTPALINRNVIPQLMRQVCLDTTKKKFLDNGIAISMDYYDMDSVLIFKVLITEADCSS